MSEQELVTGEEVGELAEPETKSPPNSEEVAAETAQPEAPSSNEAPSKEESPSTETTENGEPEPPSILTLKRGQHLTGTVKNITGFGAFVDIGLPQDGLVHISELAKQKVEKVEDVVSVGDEVEVWVKKVDKKRGRISLTMIKPIARRIRDISEGDELTGTVTRLESYGAFVDIESERDGLVHISQITHDYIKHPNEALSVGDTVQVKVLKVNKKKRQIDLSIKALTAPPEPKKEEIKEVVEEIIEEKPVPTAMALAYAAMQQDQEEGDESDQEQVSAKNKHKRELDDIISRTLATSE